MKESCSHIDWLVTANILLTAFSFEVKARHGDDCKDISARVVGCNVCRLGGFGIKARFLTDIKGWYLRRRSPGDTRRLVTVGWGCRPLGHWSCTSHDTETGLHRIAFDILQPARRHRPRQAFASLSLRLPAFSSTAFRHLAFISLADGCQREVGDVLFIYCRRS